MIFQTLFSFSQPSYNAITKHFKGESSMEIMTKTNEMTLFIDILSDMICSYLDNNPSALTETLPLSVEILADNEIPKAA